MGQTPKYGMVLTMQCSGSQSGGREPARLILLLEASKFFKLNDLRRRNPSLVALLTTCVHTEAVTCN